MKARYDVSIADTYTKSAEFVKEGLTNKKESIKVAKEIHKTLPQKGVLGDTYNKAFVFDRKKEKVVFSL